jgi:phospholipid/cholesterol/gamma-HCH transport system substrate-binding protein
MESKANYAIVGLGVIILTVALISSLLWLSTRGSSANTAFFTVYFREQTLDGLQVDSNVTMKGIKVGSVSSFNISPKNIETVRVLLKLNAETPVKMDTRAVIRRNLLTGLAYIDLTSSSQKSLLLNDIPSGEEYPVIPEGKSELSQITDSVPNLLEKSGRLFDQASMFLSKENSDAVATTLGEIARVSTVLGKQDKAIETLIIDATKITHDLRSASAALARATEEGKIDGLAEDLRGAAGEIASVVNNLNRQIEAVVQTLVRSANQIVAHTGALTGDVSRAARDFSAAIERFDEPRSTILGPSDKVLGPGEQLKINEEKR